ncbi:MAG TPA: MarR family transcriptional regulator [Kofleriaceae bacterium]|nr:MarR family transcriptional regulator [Kofleriaceae bacterium]
MQDDRFRTSLSNAVVRLFRLINRVHNRNFQQIGISAEQAHVLSVLGVLGPMTIGRLQKLLALSSATLTGAIDRLEAQDLVRRVPSPDDRRAVLIESRVPPARRAQIERVIDAGERTCFEALTVTERKELLRLLDKCIAGLEPAALAR